MVTMLAVVFVGVSRAEEGWYAGGGGSLVKFDDSVDTVDPLNIFFRVGYAPSTYFDVGGEYNFTLLSDEFRGVDFDVNILTLYVRGKVPVSDSARLYVLLGSANVELVASVDAFQASADEDDTAIGFGVENKLESGHYSTIGYTRYFDDNGITATGINFGIVSYF